MGQALLNLLDSEGPQTPTELLARSLNNPALSTFQQGTIEGLCWRLDGLGKAGIIDESGLSIDELLTPGTLSVVLMRNLPESVRGFAVGVVARLVADRMGRAQQICKVQQNGSNRS